MERGEFARAVLDRLKRSHPTIAFVLDENEFTITGTKENGESMVSSLTNFYAEHEHSPAAEKDQVLARIVRVFDRVDSEEGLDEVRVLLVPRIRPRRQFEVDAPRMRSKLGPDAKPYAFPYRPLAEHLAVAVAIDRPEQIEYISSLDRFGVPLEELESIAMPNLRRLTREGLQEIGPGLYCGAWGDEYAAERMLLPELWDGLSVKGDPVVFLPGAERIYVAGADDDRALAAAMALAEERLAMPRALLDFAFVRRDGEWRLFEPPGPLGRELGRRVAFHLADTYADQKEALEAAYADKDDAPFVPRLSGIDADGQLMATFTTWEISVSALLPRATLVAVGNVESGKTTLVAWEDFMELAGDRLAPEPGLYPPRWRTTPPLDEATLAKLEARAVEPGALGGEPGARRERAPSSEPPAAGRRFRVSPVLVLIALLVIGLVITALTRRAELSRGLDAPVVRVDRLLPRGAFEAARQVAANVRVRLQ